MRRRWRIDSAASILSMACAIPEAKPEQAMAVYVVTYEMGRDSGRPAIAEAIRGLSPAWARLSETCYAVESRDTPAGITRKLKPHLGQTDNLYVMEVRHPHAGYGPSPVNRWLAERLGR
jgi:hypothetical protein